MKSKAKTTTAKKQVEGGVRKGPWTEQEDMKLVWFVRLLGERRWDFLAKVSGLNRTGKSCRLRWVNYLHPDLKRGRMTPDEERLVVDLHAKWGNRWSRIAKSMPGRTDNEIKNYWRTHMRKQDKTTRATTASTATSTSTSTSTPATSSSSSNDNLLAHGAVDNCCHEEEEEEAATAASQEELLYTAGMDHLLWNDIDSYQLGGAWSTTTAAVLLPSSPVWDYCSDSLWGIDHEEEEYKKMLHAS